MSIRCYLSICWLQNSSNLVFILFRWEKNVSALGLLATRQALARTCMSQDTPQQEKVLHQTLLAGHSTELINDEYLSITVFHLLWLRRMLLYTCTTTLVIGGRTLWLFPSWILWIIQHSNFLSLYWDHCSKI